MSSMTSRTLRFAAAPKAAMRSTRHSSVRAAGAEQQQACLEEASRLDGLHAQWRILVPDAVLQQRQGRTLLKSALG